MLDPGLDYPSWRALVPVAGAFLVIVAGATAPANIATRLLSLGPMVGIGLVSYSWYLWHWPLLAFARSANFDQRWFPLDLLLGGFVGLFLAVATYFLVETRVRDWRKRHDVRVLSARIVGFGAAGCMATLGLGLLTSWLGYLPAAMRTEALYVGPEVRIDQTCRPSNDRVPDECRGKPIGLIFGDSHGGTLYPNFSSHYRERGVLLTAAIAPGCNELEFFFQDPKGDAGHLCKKVERSIPLILGQVSDSLDFVILSNHWLLVNKTLESAAGASIFWRRLAVVIGKFAEEGRRVLLIGPVPEFPRNGLSCVLLADRYGVNRERCGAKRTDVERRRSAVVSLMREAVRVFPNARFVDPLEAFCDESMCRPFKLNTMLYRDSHHLSDSGADLLFRTFAADFEWVAGLDRARTAADLR